jgi:16S rRNA (cytosine967-C5)-methyltransferase
MIAPARRAAYDVVRRVFEHDAYADRAFATAARGLDARDRALAQRIAYGTVQRVRTIDHGIDELGRRRTQRLDPAVRAALRITAYQVAWSDAPAHAVAHDAVELVRAAGLERATAFTNAVARRLAEGFRDLVGALPEGALKESYPDWVFAVWERDWGFAEAVALARAQNEPTELVVRSAEPVGEPTDVPGAYRVERISEALLAEGKIWPQSRGSQVAALAVGSRDGEAILDACAAPGGKATMLRGAVTAVESHPGRARELEENVRRLGAGNVRVVHADVRHLAENGFDRALVDAPCSGLGVLGRRPDLRWRARPLPDLQLELLHAAADRTSAGGTVVYAVCTINTDENEAVVDASGLEIESLAEEWPQFVHPKRPEFLLTTPHRHGTSGFFIARLRKPSDHQIAGKPS